MPKRPWSLTARDRPFLWSDTSSQTTQQISKGEIVAEFWSGQGAIELPNGLIHDWIGAVFIPHATVEDALALVQDYDNHKNIYKPEVLDSKLISRDGNDFKIFLRLLKKKIITVVLDTDHDVHYSSVDSKRWCCRSYTTRIAEVEDPGTAKERVLPPLYSYWRFQEKDGGAYVECRGISLTRDIPVWAGMDHRTDHPQAATRVADQHPASHARCADCRVVAHGRVDAKRCCKGGFCK